jgi:hypothetical protein
MTECPKKITYPRIIALMQKILKELAYCCGKE